MANLCDVHYKIVGDQEVLQSLFETLKDLKVVGLTTLNDFVNRIGIKLGLSYCRGNIDDFCLNNDVLEIYQTTAWCEQQGVRYEIERKFPDIKVYYREQEEGCGLFTTNDSTGLYFPERFMLDTGDDWEYFTTIEQAAEYVSSIVGHEVKPNVKDIFESLDLHMKNYEDSFFSFHVFEVSE